MTNMTMKELQVLLLEGHEIEFSRKDSPYSYTLNSGDNFLCLSISSLDGQFPCSYVRSDSHGDLFQEFLSAKLFDNNSKCFLDIQDDVTVDVVF